MTSRVRVLNLILGLSIGEPLGGAERLVIELTSHMDHCKFEPIVCAFWQHHTATEQNWVDYLKQSGIKVFFAVDWPGKQSLPSYRTGIENILLQLQDMEIDLIHSHFQMGNLVTLALKRRLRAKAMLRTAHAGTEWGDGLVAFVCRQVFTKWFFPMVFDMQTAVSQTGTLQINKYPGTRLSGRQAVLIHNGISLDRFYSRDIDLWKRQELGLSADHLVIGNVGRLRQEKGHSILLQAAAKILERIPDARFVIVGDGELKQELHQQSHRLGLDKAVIWAGARTDVESLYHTMDLFVLPSFWEGLSTVILESMASGVPVVASDLPGVRELIRPGETGWLVKPGDPAELASKIADALRHPDARARIAHTALHQVVPSFSIDAIADQYEQVYEYLMYSTNARTNQTEGA